MPVVPRYQRQVQTEALPGARISPRAPANAFGGVDVSGAARVTDELGALIEREKVHADQVAVLEADNKLAKVSTDLSTAAQQRRGKEAIGVTQAAQADFEKATSEIGQGLASDRQREAFRNRVEQRWSQLYAGLEAHAHREARAFDEQETSTGMSNSMNDAITDPTNADQHIAEAVARLRDFGRRNGIGPEAMKEKEADVRTKAHAGVIERMLSADLDTAATAYYAAHKEEIKGEARAAIEHALDVGTTLGESQRLSLAIVQKHERMADALADVDQISDPKVQEATRRAVKERFAEREVQARDDYEKVTDAAFTYVSQGRRPPAPIMAQLKGRELIAVNSYLASRAKKEEPQTDWGAYYKLRLLATSDDPKERALFRNANLFGFRHLLGDTEFKEMVGMQTNTRQGKSDPVLDGYRTSDQIVTGAVKGLGLDPKKDSRKIELFQRAVDADVSNWKRTNKDAQIPSDEVQKIVDGLLIKSPDGSRFEHLSTAPDDVRNIDDVPLDEQRLIRQTLIRRGIFPSMEQITELYRQRLSGIQAGLEP